MNPRYNSGPPPYNVAGNVPNEIPRSVRVSNVAPTVTQEDLTRIFSALGSVTDFWFAADEQNRPLGEAFCEFAESKTANTAASTFNGVPIKGKQIRIDIIPSHVWKAERRRLQELAEERNRPPPSRIVPAAQPPEFTHDPTANVANLNAEQMFNLLRQMKEVIELDSVQARQALLRNFTLSVGMLQAMLMMKIVDPSEALELLMKDDEPPVAEKVPLQTPVHQPPPGYPIQQPQRPELQQMRPPFSAPPQQAPLNPMYQQPPPNVIDPRQARNVRPGFGGPPPSGPPPRGFPPQPQSSVRPHISSGPPPPVVPSDQETERAAMLMQLIQMTDQQLAALSPDQRQAVLLLRQQLAMQR